MQLLQKRYDGVDLDAVHIEAGEVLAGSRGRESLHRST